PREVALPVRDPARARRRLRVRGGGARDARRVRGAEEGGRALGRRSRRARALRPRHDRALAGHGRQRARHRAFPRAWNEDAALAVREARADREGRAVSGPARESAREPAAESMREANPTALPEFAGKRVASDDLRARLSA